MSVEALHSSTEPSSLKTPESQSCLNEMVRKISQFVCSKWLLVIFSSFLVGACLGVVPGAICALVGSVLASRKSPPQAEVHTREYYVKIFQETLEAIREGKTIDMGLHQAMLKNRTIVPPFGGPFPPVENRLETKWMIEPVSTFEMSRRVHEMGYKPLVLDMASDRVAGGDVIAGAKAQEETVCRQSNLYPALETMPYPIPEKGGFWIPNVQFFRDDAYNFVKPFAVDVFVSAAYDLNLKHGKVSRPANDRDYVEGMKEKMRTMLRTALVKGEKALVLSAFGCGAFANDPNRVAKLYREVFEEAEFNGAFEVIAFGIYDPPNAIRPNCPIFQQELIGG